MQYILSEEEYDKTLDHMATLNELMAMTSSGSFALISQAVRRLVNDNIRYTAALDRLARLGNGDEYGNSYGNEIAQKALGVGKFKEESVDSTTVDLTKNEKIVHSLDVKGKGCIGCQKTGTDFMITIRPEAGTDFMITTRPEGSDDFLDFYLTMNQMDQLRGKIEDAYEG